jgi:hypothetical protein
MSRFAINGQLRIRALPVVPTAARPRTSSLRLEER